jgi:hypothetical protein
MDWQLATALGMGAMALIFVLRKMLRPWKSSAGVKSCGGTCDCK